MSDLPLGQRLADVLARRTDIPIEACYIGTDAAERLGQFARERCGAQAFIVCDENTRNAAAEWVLSALQESGKATMGKTFPAEPFNATAEAANEVAGAGETSDFYVAVGSGTVCDLAKQAGTDQKKPVLLFATAASMNGYTSGITALKVRGLKRTLTCDPAMAVFADPGIVCKAPPRMVAAGVADFLSKCSAGADWRAAHLLRDEYYDPQALQFYDGVVEAVLDAAPAAGLGDPEAVGVVLEALLLSGLSMLTAGSSSPASGGEHLISHYLDMKSALYGTPHDLHGVQVGVATVHCLRLWEEILALDPDALDVDALIAAQPTMDDVTVWAHEDWGADVAEEVLAQWREKARGPEAMAEDLARFQRDFDVLREGVELDLLPARTVADAITASGGPVSPAGMTAPIDEYMKAISRARYIRNRFTVLDLAAQLGVTV